VELPLMDVIITFTFCCDNLWKSKFVALEKPGKLREFLCCDAVMWKQDGYPVCCSCYKMFSFGDLA